MRVRISPKAFQRGVRYVRQWGGRYDAADKTWQISDDRPEIGNLLSYGLIPLDDEQAVLETVEKVSFRVSSEIFL